MKRQTILVLMIFCGLAALGMSAEQAPLAPDIEQLRQAYREQRLQDAVRLIRAISEKALETRQEVYRRSPSAIKAPRNMSLVQDELYVANTARLAQVCADLDQLIRQGEVADAAWVASSMQLRTWQLYQESLPKRKDLIAALEQELPEMKYRQKVRSLGKLAFWSAKDQRWDKALLYGDEAVRAGARDCPDVCGDGLYKAHQALGLAALARNDRATAVKELLLSGAVPSSPALSSFGPSMDLAEQLYDVGETNAVLEYLEKCRGFWTDGKEAIDQFTAQIRAGKRPDFSFYIY